MRLNAVSVVCMVLFLSVVLFGLFQGIAALVALEKVAPSGELKGPAFTVEKQCCAVGVARVDVVCGWPVNVTAPNGFNSKAAHDFIDAGKDTVQPFRLMVAGTEPFISFGKLLVA